MAACLRSAESVSYTHLSMILAAIMMLALVIMLFPVSYACAKRIAEVLNTESSIQDGRYSAALRKGRACVAFDHVTFTYPGADEPVSVSYTHLDVYKRQFTRCFNSALVIPLPPI